MLSRLLRAGMVLALCSSLGGQWPAVQSIAWASMLMRSARQMPLAQAVAQTFDGAHPCDLCKGIAAARQSEKKNEAKPAAPRPDLFYAQRTIVLLPPWTDFSFAEFGLTNISQAHSPPTPPPRSSLG